MRSWPSGCPLSTFTMTVKVDSRMTLQKILEEGCPNQEMNANGQEQDNGPYETSYEGLSQDVLWREGNLKEV